MTKKLLRVLFFLFCLSPLSVNAMEDVQVNESLHVVLQGLAARLSSDGYDHIFKAILASPQLTEQLNSLAQSGALRRMAVADTPIKGLFGASSKEDTITFLPSFIDAVVCTPPWDRRSSDAIAPNNLTFVIGHLASHMAHPKLSPTNTSRDDFTKGMIKAEAVADLDAWNDVIDGAEKENGGNQLTNGQIGYILMSLRYRAPFVLGLKQPNKLEFMPSGKFEVNSMNVDALSEALTKMKLFDFE